MHTYPAVRNCPVCRSISKLEVRSPQHIYCRACYFVGDLVELAAKARKEELFLTLQHFKSLTHIDFANAEQEHTYASVTEAKATVREFFFSKSRDLRLGVSPSLRALMASINAFFSLETVAAMGTGICWLSKEELLSGLSINKKLSAAVLREWGLYTAIGIPVWCAADIVGVYIISPRVTGYIPIVEGHPSTAAAFANLTSSASTVVVMDNIVAAFRMNVWAANEDSDTVFVVPPVTPVLTDDYAGKRTVFWAADDSLEFALRAMGTPSATVFQGRSLGDAKLEKEYYQGVTFSRVVERLSKASPAHQEVARRIALLPNSESVKAALGGRSLSPLDKSKILSYTLPQDFERVREYLDEGITSRVVMWGGKEVKETHEGWLSEGKIISSAILRVEEIRTQGPNGEAEVVGTVVYKRTAHGFRTPLEQLRRSPGEWLTKFVIGAVGSVPYIEAGWRMKLLELAQQFHEPRPVFKNGVYGWEAEELKLPQFTVSKYGVQALRSNNPGPQIPLPAPLSPAEWQAFESHGFCSLFLALAANLLRSQNGSETFSIYLVNESHVLPRVASFLVSRVLTSVSPGDLRDSGYAPLPIVVSATPDTSAALFSGDARRYTVTSVDQHTATLLSINRRWLRVRVQQVIEYPALRALFHALPELLRLGVDCRDADDIFRSLATVLESTLKDQLPEVCRLSAAAFEMDLYSRATDATAATNIMRLIFSGIQSQAITPDIRVECVRIPIPAFRKYVRSPTVETPSVAQLTATLMEAKFLIEDPEQGYWAFGRNIWDINSSIASVYAG